ncbi:tripartite motif-containing protein 2-like [Strongylocentrotus purpuratus]|uniref:Uncharacterized protein n=1 Tax=Strongylocentrotus purpuratus TaxID=7668 RepID=A0A7M7HGW2_STRPU|nr:tripartite motif-containing protein 2 [Strongylocentrotus purpuratus]XP_030840912.1 tripartite motif-containing protein 2-like [Strongylocentrotus purpuratus]|eukprot:XP_011675471.1 PREDICTED: tripartite motif-containing protein 2-like [Strongylocentrotus purpuratus]
MERKRKLTLYPDMAEHLMCTICSDTFDDPRNLVCGHVFCKKCLDILDESQLGSPLKTSICCPTCSRKTKLRESRVNGFSRNLPIRKLLHQDLSEEPGPSGKRPKRTPTCKTHNQERRDIYCSTCLVFICFKCFQEKHTHHVTKTRNEFLGELSQMTKDAKQRYQVQLKTLENNLLEADQGVSKLIIHHNNAKQSIEDEFKAELAQLNKNITFRLQSLTKSTKNLESDVARFKEKGKHFKQSLAIAVPKLESKTLEELDGEDLKSYVKTVDTVLNLLKTDIGVEHLKLWNKLLVPSAPSRPQHGCVPSTSGGTAGQALQKVSPKSINKPL